MNIRKHPAQFLPNTLLAALLACGGSIPAYAADQANTDTAAQQQADADARQAERQAQQAKREAEQAKRESRQQAERQAQQARREADQSQREAQLQASLEAQQAEREAQQSKREAEQATREAQQQARQEIEQAQREAQRQAEQSKREAQLEVEQSQREAQQAEQEMQRSMQKLDAMKDRDDFKQLDNIDRQAQLDQLKVLKDYDFTRIARQTQIAALDKLNDLPAHHHQAVDSGDQGGGDSQLNERRPLNADGRVYVNDIAGTVVVNAWDKNEVLLTGSLSSGADHLEVSGDASNLSFVVKLPKHSHDSGDSDLRLLVPFGSRVELETVSADVSVRGTRGPLKVTSVSGDVGVDVQSQEVSVQTVKEKR